VGNGAVISLLVQATLYHSMMMMMMMMMMFYGRSGRVGGMVGSDRSEELVKTLLEHISSLSSVSDELARQRPVAGDLQSVRQQQDVVQVDSLSIIRCRTGRFTCYYVSTLCLKKNVPTLKRYSSK